MPKMLVPWIRFLRQLSTDQTDTTALTKMFLSADKVLVAVTKVLVRQL